MTKRSFGPSGETKHSKTQAGNAESYRLVVISYVGPALRPLASLQGATAAYLVSGTVEGASKCNMSY